MRYLKTFKEVIVMESVNISEYDIRDMFWDIPYHDRIKVRQDQYYALKDGVRIGTGFNDFNVDDLKDGLSIEFDTYAFDDLVIDTEWLLGEYRSIFPMIESIYDMELSYIYFQCDEIDITPFVLNIDALSELLKDYNQIRFRRLTVVFRTI